VDRLGSPRGSSVDRNHLVVPLLGRQGIAAILGEDARGVEDHIHRYCGTLLHPFRTRGPHPLPRVLSGHPGNEFPLEGLTGRKDHHGRKEPVGIDRYCYETLTVETAPPKREPILNAGQELFLISLEMGESGFRGLASGKRIDYDHRAPHFGE
jgi:hypothetical protein